MTVSSLKLVTKTSDKIKDDLIQELVESRDWSQLRRNQKVDVEISNPEFLELFRVHGKRIRTLIDGCVSVAIEKFWSVRISDLLVTTNSEELQKLFETNISDNAVKSRKTLLKQQESKLAISGKLDWVKEYFSGILSEIRILPGLIKPISLSQVNAAYVDKLVCFDCNIDGVETQQAIEDRFNTRKSGFVFAEMYDKDQHGGITETFFDDFQYYWLREPIKEFSRKKSLRKIAGQSFGKHVSRYETSDKVRVLGFYRTLDQKGVDEKGVEIEIINMEKLDDDVEITLSKEELLEFKELSNDNPEEFISNFTKSCAPHIQGNDTAKLGIVIAEVGPTNLVEKYRPHIHLYLTGNPGTAKSEMLKWFAKISFMGVYADAPNASARGLMYGQEEHGKRKILKAGLMVRNKKLYLDELDKMGETRQELNTAMEQQIASYHKNPFDIDTDIDCTVIAAGNPQFGKWKDGIDIVEQLKPIKPELQSRFLIIRVTKSGDTRKRLSHVFDTMQKRDKIKPKFSERQIAGLLNHCRKLNPPMSEKAENLILDFAEMFEGIKQDEESNLDFETRAQINVIRVSTAFAKLLQKQTIDEACAKIAISFIKECNKSLGMATELPTVQSDLVGIPIDRNVAFLQIVKLLQKNSSDDGCFSESNLVIEMMQLPQFWKTEESAVGYWKRHNPNYNAKSEYYEPHPGRFQRV